MRKMAKDPKLEIIQINRNCVLICESPFHINPKNVNNEKYNLSNYEIVNFYKL